MSDNDIEVEMPFHTDLLPMLNAYLSPVSPTLFQKDLVAATTDRGKGKLCIGNQLGNGPSVTIPLWLVRIQMEAKGT